MLTKTTDSQITSIPITELFLADEAPRGANLVVRNSNAGSPLTDAELKASINASGIIFPLLYKVIDGQKYVVAGNRRLKALRELLPEENAIENTVPVRDVDSFDSDWREIAMNSNLALPPHPVERYELLVVLIKDLKLSPEDARQRYGLTPRHFNQVMSLGKMSPTVRESWKAGEIEDKVAHAFTLESDTKEQDRILAAARKRGGSIDLWFVKEKIIPAAQRNTGVLVTFVGIDVCKKAKIIKQEDFFSHDHIVTDVKALNKLAGDKLDEKCKELAAEGWSWALPKNKIEGSAWDYGSLVPGGKSLATAVEKARMTEIEKLIDADNNEDVDLEVEALIEEREKIEEAIKARGFTTEQRAKAGCFIEVASDGSLKIEYGKTKPAEKRSAAASERAKSTSAKKDKAKAAGETVLTAALAERLSTQLQTAGAEVLKVNYAVAVAALIAGFACQKGTPIDVAIGDVRGKPSAFDDVFTVAFKSTPEQREAMLAQVTAQAFSIVTYNPEKMPLDNPDIAEMFEAMKGPVVVKEIAAAFNIKDYFASISGASVVEAVRCVMGDDHAAKVAKMDKGAKAKFAAANLTFEKTGWLPKALRTVWYTGPVEGSAKTAKPAKKASAKKAAKKK